MTILTDLVPSGKLVRITLSHALVTLEKMSRILAFYTVVLSGPIAMFARGRLAGTGCIAGGGRR